MNGLSSVFDAYGIESQAIATLALVLVIGAVAVMVLVAGTLALAMAGSGTARALIARERTVTLLGITLPVVALTALLHYSLIVMSEEAAPAANGAPPDIAISGEQYWWRVSYAGAFAGANEIRIPAGRRTVLHLTSPDVIHSFWVPSLAGKIDLIPGRVTSLTLTPQRPGVFRGICAEFCGPSHAFMAFTVIAMPPAEYDMWRAREAAPAAAPADDRARHGAELFRQAGCGACHAVRGTTASGSIGPDLTHLGSRTTIGAGTLKMSEANLARFVADSDLHKPGNAMPPFRIFDAAGLQALAAYLSGLK